MVIIFLQSYFHINNIFTRHHNTRFVPSFHILLISMKNFTLIGTMAYFGMKLGNYSKCSMSDVSTDLNQCAMYVPNFNYKFLCTITLFHYSIIY